MKNPRATVFLAIILIAPAIAAADNISGRSKSGSNHLTFSDGLTDEQDLQGNAARCNFLLGSTAENGSRAGSIAAATLSGLAKGPDAHSPTLVDFGLKPGASSDKDKGKGKGKHNGPDNGGNGPGLGNGAPAPLVAVPEPRSQTLLLVGLAGFGMAFYRRRTLTNAI
ncbi:MAG TPA: hypothetical protein VNH19_01285 [Candidatus Limnocylindrales bacterium]|nr:hypothetical protein [Candidatus Limnocylindrales bacterium]